MSTNDKMVGRDRIAIVTGGSSGIGLAVARLLAQRGCHVWLVARQPEKLAAALAEVKASRIDEEQICGTISADVSDPEQASAAVELVTKEVGAPHLLVNSAGVALPGYFHELKLEDFRWMMDINYFGTVYMVRAVLPGMKANGGGHIVNISSVAGFLGIFGYSAYGASKFAVAGISDILRAELKPHGIRVSIVYPPDVDTPQLAFEAPFRPAETQILAEDGPILRAEMVAETIVRGIDRGQYTIIPSLYAKSLYLLTNNLRNFAQLVMDLIVARSIKKKPKV